MTLNVVSSRINASLAAVAATVAISAAPTPAAAQSDPFVGQLMAVGFNFCPRGWSTTEGQLLAISSNNALFALLGTTYGGDGRTTFGLPDLRGRSAIGQGSGPGLSPKSWGQRGGAQTHTLTVNEMPSHSHTVRSVQEDGDRARPNSDFIAGAENNQQRMYHNGPATATMDPGMIANTGGNQGFNIENPSLSVYWCIALQGVFPPRN